MSPVERLLIGRTILIAAQTHEDGPQRENREANSVQPVWKNLANKRQAYPTREKPPFEFRGAEELLLLYMQVQD